MGVMGKRLIGSRQTEEMVVETWHRIQTQNRWNQYAVRWLQETPMQGSYCMPANAVGGDGCIYFECQEDAVLFRITWE